MNTKVLAVFILLMFVLLCITLFIAGYEKGKFATAQVTQNNISTQLGVNKQVDNSVKSIKDKVASKTVLPDKPRILAHDAKIVSGLIDGDSNEIADEINFEFNKSTPLIISNSEGSDYSIETLAEDIMNKDMNEPDLDKLSGIKSEIFVYVGLMKESDAISAVEFFANSGFTSKIIYKSINGNSYAFVIAGPFLLKKNAKYFEDFAKKHGYKSSQMIQ